jgi:hypothetical protein
MVQSKHTTKIPALPESKEEVLQAPSIATGTPAKEEHLSAAKRQLVFKRESKRKRGGVAAADVRRVAVKLEHEAAVYPGASGVQQVDQRVLQALQQLLKGQQRLLQSLKDYRNRRHELMNELKDEWRRVLSESESRALARLHNRVVN